jgi:hypothetical protein
MNVCCLLWNFWILNSTNQWKFSQVGYGGYELKDKDVFGNIWTSDAGKAPPLFLFDEVCPNGFPITNESFVDAYTCGSCTSDKQCSSGDCCNGLCQKTSLACCGENECEPGESCSSCPQDCGLCPTTVQEIIRGGGYIKTTTTTTTQTTIPATTKSIQITTTTISLSTSTTTTTPTNVTNTGSKPSPLTGFVTFAASPLGIGLIAVIIVMIAIFIKKYF